MSGIAHRSTGPRPGVKPQPVTRMSHNRIQITALINDCYACGGRKGGDVLPLKALYNAEIPMVGGVVEPCDTGGVPRPGAAGRVENEDPKMSRGRVLARPDGRQ